MTSDIQCRLRFHVESGERRWSSVLGDESVMTEVELADGGEEVGRDVAGGVRDDRARGLTFYGVELFYDVEDDSTV